jgi:hypothetical protein
MLESPPTFRKMMGPYVQMAAQIKIYMILHGWLESHHMYSQYVPWSLIFMGH